MNITYFKSKNYIPLIFIMLLSLTLRLIWIKYVPTVPVSDFLQYYNGAVSMVQGNGYRNYGHISAYEPVGYSLFLTTLYFFFGTSIIVGKFANLALSLIGLVFIYLIVKRCFNEKLAYICALLYAILPLNILYTSVLSTEIIFTTLFIILNYLILRKDEITYSNILIGVLLGVLTLIKPYMLIYQMCIFLLEIIKFKSLKLPLKNLLLITGILIVTISPWTIRNYFVFHKLIPVSTNGGYNLYINNNPDAIGAWRDPSEIHGSIILKYKDKNDNFWDEVKVDEEGKKYAFQWIIHNPLSFAKLGTTKVKNTFFTSDSGFWSTSFLANNKTFQYTNLLRKFNSRIQFFTIIIMSIYFITIVLKILLKKLRNTYIHQIITINILFFLAITFIFEGQPRYLFPLWPIFIIASVYTLNNLINERFKNLWIKKSFLHQ